MAPPDCLVWGLSSAVAKQRNQKKVIRVKISFNLYVYYLTRGFIASTSAFNLLAAYWKSGTQDPTPLGGTRDLIGRTRDPGP